MRNNNKSLADEPGEIWLFIPNWVGKFMVSNRSRVKGVDRLTIGRGGCSRKVREKILSQTYTPDGYLLTPISGINDEGIKIDSPFSVHRLIALAFIANRENKPQVNHKNGLKDDNSLENLEWATPSEQQIHARKLGLHPGVGETHVNAKLTDNQVTEICKSALSNKQLADIFKVDWNTISRIRGGASRSSVSGLKYKRRPTVPKPIIKRILKSPLSSAELSRKLNIQASKIYYIRSKRFKNA